MSGLVILFFMLVVVFGGCALYAIVEDWLSRRAANRKARLKVERMNRYCEFFETDGSAIKPQIFRTVPKDR
ncbi:MAG: hypothetical protein JO308_03965 [Verrucomicrobia bacterium]|nr:hypothetical protein [Verrucomicrobiota bacterium]